MRPAAALSLRAQHQAELDFHSLETRSPDSWSPVLVCATRNIVNSDRYENGNGHCHRHVYGLRATGYANGKSILADHLGASIYKLNLAT